MSPSIETIIAASALILVVWTGIYVIADTVTTAVGRHRRRWGR